MRRDVEQTFIEFMFERFGEDGGPIGELVRRLKQERERSEAA